jgi:hypothetical protein
MSIKAMLNKFGIDPAFEKYLFVHGIFLSGGIGDFDCVVVLFLFDTIADYEMVLIPVQNAGKESAIYQLLKIDSYPLCMHTDTFGGVADAEHGNTFAGDEGFFSKGLEGVTATVMFGDHAEAGGAAIHGIQLEIVRKRFH